MGDGHDCLPPGCTRMTAHPGYTDLGNDDALLCSPRALSVVSDASSSAEQRFLPQGLLEENSVSHDCFDHENGPPQSFHAASGIVLGAHDYDHSTGSLGEPVAASWHSHSLSITDVLGCCEARGASLAHHSDTGPTVILPDVTALLASHASSPKPDNRRAFHEAATTPESTVSSSEPVIAENFSGCGLPVALDALTAHSQLQLHQDTDAARRIQSRVDAIAFADSYETRRLRQMTASPPRSCTPSPDSCILPAPAPPVSLAAPITDIPEACLSVTPAATCDSPKALLLSSGAGVGPSEADIAGLVATLARAPRKKVHSVRKAAAPPTLAAAQKAHCPVVSGDAGNEVPRSASHFPARACLSALRQRPSPCGFASRPQRPARCCRYRSPEQRRARPARRRRRGPRLGLPPHAR